MFGTGRDSRYITSLKANDYNVKTELVTGEKYSYLNLPDDTRGVRESTNAGVINPRKLIEAQQRLASEQGCTLIDDVVHKCERIVKSNGEYAMLIKTEGGKTVNAKSVLLCTGAFGKFRDVLPKNVSTEHKISPVTVVLMEVEEQFIGRLRDMPCMIYKGQRHNDWVCPAEIRPEDDIDFYILPPITYPDGRTYIKLGMTDPRRGHLETGVDVKHWFNVGNPTFQEHIATFTESIFNDIHFLSWKGDSCVIMDTPTNRPYIDKVHDQLGVAIGCNGYAAKSSDEIGRLAVNMIQGEWNYDLKQDLFKIRIEHCSKL